jgi:hypothetical protein
LTISFGLSVIFITSGAIIAGIKLKKIYIYIYIKNNIKRVLEA